MIPDELRGSAAHVFTDTDPPVLSADEHHHLAHVLRLRAGEPVSVSDGRGRYRMAVWAGGSDPAAALAEIGPWHPGPVPARRLTVALAVVKGDRPEWAVQKLTEIGVGGIVLYHAARSAVRWDGPRRAKVTDRLTRVAREAASQSRRTTLPTVHVADDLAGALAAAGPLPALRAEPGGGALPPWPAAVLCIGPEGGWSADEQALVPATAGLGGTVLRTETAALVGAALLLDAEGGEG